MRAMFIPLVVAATAALALLTGPTPSYAGDLRLFASAVPNASRASRTMTPKADEPVRYANACGLCTDEDCCGGTENGWKLCKNGCPEGQYKCEQVAYCK